MGLGSNPTGDLPSELLDALNEFGAADAPDIDAIAVTETLRSLGPNSPAELATLAESIEQVRVSSPWLNWVDGTSLAAKFGATVVVAAAIGGAGYAIAPDATPLSPPPAPPPRTAANLSAAPQQAAPSIEATPPLVVATPSSSAVAPIETRLPGPPPKHAAPGGSITEEVQHLGHVRRAFKSDPALAYRLAKDGHQKFTSGALYEEREALLILALARSSGAAAARTRAERYVRRFPKGAFTRRVKSDVLD